MGRRGYEFQAFGTGDGFGAAVRFEVSDDDVDSLGVERLGFFEHAVGLADSGGVAQVDLEMAGALHGSSGAGAFNAETQRARRKRRSVGATARIGRLKPAPAQESWGLRVGEEADVEVFGGVD